MKPLWQMPAWRLADLIRQRKLSSLEVTQAYIERIELVNPLINALVVPCFEQALQQARNWDASPRAGAALGGVPFSLKEILHVAGQPCTIGSLYRKDYLASQNASVVQRIFEAGGILLGQTNLPERSFWSESYNLIYGRTRNPYDLSRIPGGSSGGEAALIAAGASPLGLGSDIAGSIRMPAFYCGIFGHKPSAGLVPGSGHYPFELPKKGAWPNTGAVLYMAIGPLARNVKDLRLALELIAGPDGLDPTCYQRLAPEPTQFDWRGRKVYLIPKPKIQHCSPVESEIARSVLQAARALEKLGAELEELPADLFRQGVEFWSAALAEGQQQMRQMLGDGQHKIPLWQESFKLFSGQSQHTPPALLFAWIDQFQGLRAGRRRQLMQELARLRSLVQRRLKQEHVLLLPPQPTVAPLHDELLRRPFDFGYTAIINALQLPATAVPMGLNAQGLPLGVQVVAADGQDRLCLRAAQELEEAFGGWTPPLKRIEPSTTLRLGN